MVSCAIVLALVFLLPAAALTLMWRSHAAYRYKKVDYIIQVYNEQVVPFTTDELVQYLIACECDVDAGPEFIVTRYDSFWRPGSWTIPVRAVDETTD